MERDWRNWDWRKKKEDAKNRRENASEMKINGLFFLKSGGESTVGEEAAARGWKTNLGLASSYSSRKSIPEKLGRGEVQRPKVIWVDAGTNRLLVEFKQRNAHMI